MSGDVGLREAVEALLDHPTWHRGMYGCPDDMIAARQIRALLAAHPPAVPDAPQGEMVTIPRPSIHTGPKHLTADEATAMYLRDAAGRVRTNRYWGSGVSALVVDVLELVAQAVETQGKPS